MGSSSLPEGLHEIGSEGVVPVKFVTGAAGTGKTYGILQEIAADPKFGILTATTGIAAMNLGTITLNSVLKYFDTESLEEAFINGFLQRKLMELSKEGYRYLVIDELSMMPKQQLDILYQALKQVNELIQMAKPDGSDEDYEVYVDGQGNARKEFTPKRSPLGLLLTGDFCQLPPIPDKKRKEKVIPWVFDAACWPEFEANTVRLSKVWRQSDVRFLEAINQIRSGNGSVGVALLQNCGVEFVQHADTVFDGTTIMPKNKAVDGFNWICHSKLPGVPIFSLNSRWGEQLSEWRSQPEQVALKPGALVMVLANETQSFTYVNGDLGHVESLDDLDGVPVFAIRLKRNNTVVPVTMVTRVHAQKQPPDSLLIDNMGMGEAELRKKYNHPKEGLPYWDVERRKWILGAITYWPLRLGYASTVHKTQGLSLDKVQVDVHDHFFGSPAMAYVSISRCRTAGGLRIVGSPTLLAARVNVAPEVKRWL